MIYSAIMEDLLEKPSFFKFNIILVIKTYIHCKLHPVWNLQTKRLIIYLTCERLNNLKAGHWPSWSIKLIFYLICWSSLYGVFRSWWVDVFYLTRKLVFLCLHKTVSFCSGSNINYFADIYKLYLILNLR